MDTIKLVFDNKEWNGKDVGDNSCFYKPAIIVSKYVDIEGRLLADVVFLASGRVSHGHFVDSMREVV